MIILTPDSELQTLMTRRLELAAKLRCDEQETARVLRGERDSELPPQEYFELELSSLNKAHRKDADAIPE